MAYYSFYAENGRYDIEFSGGSIPSGEEFKLEDVQGNNLIYNVRDFGATGDGTTDDTAAIQATIDAMVARYSTTNGVGAVTFPNGTYLVTAPKDAEYVFDLPSGIVIQGTGGPVTGGDVSNCTIVLGSENSSIFGIRTDRQKIAIRDLGMTTQVESNEYTIGILAKQADGLGSTFDIEFSNLNLWNFGRGISIEGSNEDHQWDITTVKIDHCLITDCQKCIYVNTQNCAFLNITDCHLGVVTDGFGIYFEKVGLASINRILGAGVPGDEDVAETFIYLTAGSGTINISGCECEGFKKSMHVVSLEVGEIAWPIGLYYNTFGNNVLLESECVVNSVGNKYHLDTVVCDPSAKATFLSFGDIFIDLDKTPAPNGGVNLNGGDNRLASRFNQFRADIQVPTRIGGLAGETDDVIAHMPLALTPLVEHGAHMTFCDEDGDPLYTLSADGDGLHVEYAPSRQRILTLDSDGNLTTLGNMTPNGTP